MVNIFDPHDIYNIYITQVVTNTSSGLDFQTVCEDYIGQIDLTYDSSTG